MNYLLSRRGYVYSSLSEYLSIWHILGIVLQHFFECQVVINCPYIPESVTKIGEGAFSGCDGLTEVTIPGSVQTIRAGVFSKCKNLTRVNILEGVTDIESDGLGNSSAFNDCPMEASPLYSLFLTLLLAAGLVLALEFVGVYLSFCAAKQKPNSVHNLLNVLGVSTLPLTLACLTNLLLGLIYPTLTICTLVIALIMHIVLLYEGMKRLAVTKGSPIWMLALTTLVICVIFLFSAGSIAESALTDLFDMMASAGMDFFDKTFGGSLGGLLSLF